MLKCMLHIYHVDISLFNGLSAIAFFTEKRHFINAFEYKRMSAHYIFNMNFKKKKTLIWKSRFFKNLKYEKYMFFY